MTTWPGCTLAFILSHKFHQKNQEMQKYVHGPRAFRLRCLHYSSLYHMGPPPDLDLTSTLISASRRKQLCNSLPQTETLTSWPSTWKHCRETANKYCNFILSKCLHCAILVLLKYFISFLQPSVKIPCWSFFFCLLFAYSNVCVPLMTCIVHYFAVTLIHNLKIKIDCLPAFPEL